MAGKNEEEEGERGVGFEIEGAIQLAEGFLIVQSNKFGAESLRWRDDMIYAALINFGHQYWRLPIR